MLSVLRQALTSPFTGPVATGIAFALAVTLGLASNNWRVERQHYEARIAELDQASERTQTGLRNELAACHAASDARQATETADAAKGATPAGARRLLEQEPAGIDACARMESADRAVLSNLKK